MNLLASAPEGVERALAGVDALLVDPQQLHRAHEVHCEWDYWSELRIQETLSISAYLCWPS